MIDAIKTATTERDAQGDLAIGELSRQADVKIPTIRYYESIGLMKAPPRSSGGRRVYGDRDLSRLTFIRHARELGFDIEDIRTLLSLQDNPEQPCAEADAIARTKLEEVNARLAALTALKGELEAMIGGCRHACVGDCRVIQVLSDHSQCQERRHPPL